MKYLVRIFGVYAAIAMVAVDDKTMFMLVAEVIMIGFWVHLEWSDWLGKIVLDKLVKKGEK